MEKEELRARIHDEGTRVGVILRGLGGVLRNGRRIVGLDGEIGEAVGHREDGGWLLERSIVR